MSITLRPLAALRPGLRSIPRPFAVPIAPMAGLNAVHPIRHLSSTPKMSAKDESTKTQQVDPPLSQKLNDLRTFLGNHKTVMLVTRNPNGAMHARTMATAEISPDWKFRFLYDRDSYKDNEVANDDHATIAVDGTDKHDGWASIACKAKRVTDNDLVKKLYNPMIKAWFGDKGDGVHTGGPEDPRIAVLELAPEEIRHFHQEKTQLGVVVDVVASAISGNTANPGSIRTIKGEEIRAAWDKGQLSEP